MLEEFEPVMQRHIDKLCKKLSDGSSPETGSAPRNMAQWCEFFTFDVIGAFAFGQKLNMLGSNENHFIMDALHKYSQLMGVYLQVPDLSKLGLEQIAGVLTTWTNAQKAWKAWINDFATQVLDTSLGGDSGIFANFVKARDAEGKKLKMEELWAEGVFLFLACQWS